MNRILKRLKTKFSRQSVIAESEELRIPVGVRPTESSQEDYSIEIGFDAEVPGRVERHASINVLIPDKDASDCTVTQAQLRILRDSSPDASASTGFNPYDTAVLKKTWESNSR